VAKGTSEFGGDENNRRNKREVGGQQGEVGKGACRVHPTQDGESAEAVEELPQSLTLRCYSFLPVRTVTLLAVRLAAVNLSRSRMLSEPSQAAALVNSTLSLAPGAVGGFCNCVTGHPIDLVKVRLQVATTSSSGTGGVLGMLRSIVETSGVRGLYQGVSAPLVAVVPAFAVSFGSYEWAKYQIIMAQQQQRGDSERDEPQSSLTLPQIATAGAVSGLALAAVLGPLERIKCLLQVQTSTHTVSFVSMVQHCYRTGGLRSLFRGTALTVARDVPGNAAYFGTYELVRRTLLNNSNSNNNETISPNKVTAITLLAGGLAGCGNWIVAIPLDVVKSRWQTSERYVSVRHCVLELIQKEGPTALFRGLTPALMRAFPANAACLLGVETTKSCLHHWQHSDLP